MDPDTRRLMLFAGGLGAVLVVLIGASALTGRHSGEIPVVSADPRPVREKPVNPGGMKIDGAENDVFSGGSDTSNARLAPAPEAPNAMALRSQADTPPAVAEPPMAPAAKAPAPVTKPAVVASTAPKVTPAKPQIVETRPAPAEVKPQIVDAKPQAAGARPQIAETKPQAVEAKPQAGAGHSPMIQLAALPTEEAAHTEWTQLTKKMPDLLNDRQPNFSRIERDGRTYWRVRTAGFADVAQARSFCDRVRAKGAGCSVADF